MMKALINPDLISEQMRIASDLVRTKAENPLWRKPDDSLITGDTHGTEQRYYPQETRDGTR